MNNFFRRFAPGPREMVCGTLTLLFSCLAVLFAALDFSIFLLIPCIAAIIIFSMLLSWTFISPDTVKATHTNQVLNIAGATLSHMRKGLDEDSSVEVCRLLLPSTAAQSISIYDEMNVLGFAGAERIWNEMGDPLPLGHIRLTIMRSSSMLIKATELPEFDKRNPFEACVIAPMRIRGDAVGALKFYYRKSNQIDETQRAMVEGFAQLLSTQLALAELDRQTEMASIMELKALQAQINPHFLFNTINTIASLIRTDATRARELLREFASFYRYTLEGSMDLVTVEQELNQTQSYLKFEKARFGEERIFFEVDIQEGLENLQIPAFIIQPLVENAVGHGMKDTEPLNILVTVKRCEEDILMCVSDDGRGMAEAQRADILQREAAGAGIALKNVSDRLKGYFSSNSGIEIESKTGKGTSVYLRLVSVGDSSVGSFSLY